MGKLKVDIINLFPSYGLVDVWIAIALKDLFGWSPRRNCSLAINCNTLRSLSGMQKGSSTSRSISPPRASSFILDPKTFTCTSIPKISFVVALISCCVCCESRIVYLPIVKTLKSNSRKDDYLLV